MEVLTGDRNIPEAAAEEDFPVHITPFSETHQLVFLNPTAVAMTPQKLPISCNGRSAADPAQLRTSVNRKRKRRRSSSCSSSTRKSRRLERLEHHVESLVNQMMEKQEDMRKRLIEMVQDMEKERIAKEEAWKQRELERITRDEEVRAQEISRSLAMINFVQNLLGGDVQVPQPVPLVAQPVAFPSSNIDHQFVEENNNLHKDTEIVKFRATPNDNGWQQTLVGI